MIRGFSLLVLGAAFALTTLPTASAAPNTTDLNGFRGKASGTSRVQIGASTYRGKSKVYPKIIRSFGVVFKIKASVRAGTQSVSVNNELTFLPSGKMRGENLVPGVTEKARFKGTYTVTGNTIEFTGPFKVGPTEGTFRGTIRKAQNGRLTVTHSVFISTNTDPSYIYTYIGK